MHDIHRYGLEISYLLIYPCLGLFVFLSILSALKECPLDAGVSSLFWLLDSIPFFFSFRLCFGLY